MPIPQKNLKENKDVFISRCMNDSKMKSEYPNIKQRAALCYAQLKK